MLDLIYITNNPQVAKIAEDSGVDWIFVDMEFIGKDDRQGGLDTVQNHHTIQDIRNVREAVSKSQVLVRVNPIHKNHVGYFDSEEEIGKAVEAGADMVAPSDMMDGRVAAIRECLDKAGHYTTPIMSYAVKYASAFYGPFREAADSAPSFGDRKSYQMDFHNRREGMKEALTDVEEGADIIMVKPAMSYLDMVSEVSKAVNVPVATYSVSGEYAMVKAAAEKGWIDEKKIVCENMIAI